ncbi:PD-(D/E)XK nuclease-like domain-containing protein [Rhodovulum sp. 12E13]|uniref:PD-(D/E)XK nuclease-like domain-containing protein n=1 Tax=Rhodovulum sp. 12E13 TaxID=2203891 RepID=UPI001314121A|nr:PD-(D/E)XK nuclease-like domain-containing protein [Rhodovulum sp. 12E13]
MNDISQDPAPGLQEGLHRLAADKYHADPCPGPSLSSTLAKVLVTRSPLHAWHASPRLNPDFERRDSKVFDIGRAAHRSLLGAGDDFVEFPPDLRSPDGGIRTKEAKAKDAELRAAGLTPLKTEEIKAIEEMSGIARRRLAELGVEIDPAFAERVAIAKIDGVWCRAMLDHVADDPAAPIFDLKTCEDASPEAVQRAIATYGYDVQAGHYRDVFRAATGEPDFRRFFFGFQEKKRPHEMTLVELSYETLDIGHRKAARARALWGSCLLNGTWPGYPVGLHTVDLPAWSAAAWFERESVEQSLSA